MRQNLLPNPSKIPKLQISGGLCEIALPSTCYLKIFLNVEVVFFFKELNRAMSKRNSVSGGNTLFNYFTKTPPANKKVKANEDAGESPKLDSVNAEKDLKIESK